MLYTLALVSLCTGEQVCEKELYPIMTEKDPGWAVLPAAPEMENDVKLPAAPY